jgi:hypothetical protein
MIISDFVSQMSVGMARTNRFSVNFNLPGTLNAGVQGLTSIQDMLLFCDQVQIPGLTLNTNPNRVYGEVRETPYEFNYEPITISFYVDSNMMVKTIFDSWIKYIQNGDDRSFRYYDEYICKQMHILVQDLMDDTQYQVTLFEVYPKSIGAVQLDYAAKDIMKISVTLVYKYWRSINLQKPKQSGEKSRGIDYGNGAVDQVGDPNTGFKKAFSSSTIKNDIHSISSIPQQYFSDFNGFQNNLYGNIKSNINNTINQGVNNLTSKAKGVFTDLGSLRFDF